MGGSVAAALQPLNSAFHVEHVPVEVLVAMAAPYNPRTITDHDLEALRRSMRKFGVVEPVVVNRRSKRIVGGHQRVRAAQLEEIEALPVAWVDLSEDDERALNLALNRIHGEWDDGKLRELLGHLETSGVDLNLTGFDPNELENYLGTIIDDPASEWDGMPEFDQPNALGFRSIVVHFKDQEAVERFETALGIQLTEKRRFIYYPAVEPDRTTGLTYESET